MADKVRYRKVYLQFWLDADVRSLCHYDQLIALYCLTGPQSNRIGIFTFSIAVAAEELRESNDVHKPETDRFANGLERVCERLGWRYDDQARVLYIPSWWKWNAPDNANNMKGNLKDLSKVPESPLIAEFASNTQYLHGTVLDAFRKALPTGIATGMATQGTGNREQILVEDPHNNPPQPNGVPEPVAEPVQVSKPKTSTPVVTLDSITIAVGMDTPEVRASIEEWLRYKRLRRESYKTPRHVELLLEEFHEKFGRDGPAEFCKGVKASMARNYAGLFPDKDGHDGNSKSKNDRRELAHARGQRRVFD